MKRTVNLLAFDLGASSGRAMLGRYDGERLNISELYRFENNFYERDGMSYWDTDAIFAHMKDGFRAFAKGSFGPLDAFGIDSWGVDYGLLDSTGKLIGYPRAYRAATDKEMLAAWQVVSKREMFEHTGIAAMNFNTAYQLFRRVYENDAELAQAEKLLLIPDLLGYMFTGEMMSEYTNVTTTNLYNPSLRSWDYEIIRRLGIPEKIFTPIDRAGTMRGVLKANIAAETGVNDAPLVAVGTHDTASAVAAVPGSGDFVFCSSGTWSLFGTETDTPALGEDVFSSDFSNEGTVQGGFRPLKNIMGLWLIQECKREWKRCGLELSWDDIVHEAQNSQPFKFIIDPDYGDFFAGGNMVQKIARYCERTGQGVPDGVGETARAVYESLALKYRLAIARLGKIKGHRITSLNIVGGGIRNELLNQMAADASGVEVIAGPAESASAGNMLMQLEALGEIKDIHEARAVAVRSFETRRYLPHGTKDWSEPFEKLMRFMEH